MYFFQKIVIYGCLIVTIVWAQPLEKQEENFKENIKKPAPKHSGVFDETHNQEEIAEELNKWKSDSSNNIWELSGLYQGDIMGIENPSKNGLLDETTRWPDAIIPYMIDEDDFSKEDIKKIKDALEVYHQKTCVRFRPYKKGDKDFITVKGDSSGCWSYVGKHDEGQVVNFQNPGCLRHGTIVHEFMHAIGFYHQQSAADRDEWVTIVWENIKPGREHNFDKYDNKTVTDYGIEYDYKSVMHYSATAFSSNGEKTIVSKKANITLGQRDGFSEKDIQKVNKMYKAQCEAREKKENEINENCSSPDSIIGSLWPFTIFSWFKKN